MSAVLEAREPSARYLAVLEPPLLDQFDLIAQAPNGVTRLRELILTLAVQGKLVPQDPNDEPASALLERIRAEKARLVKEGKIRKDKPLAAIAEEENPFGLPARWEFVRLGDLALSIKSGGTPSKQNPTYWNGEIPWASVKDLKVGTPITSTQDFITSTGLEAGSCLAEAGSILVCTRMGLGKIGEALIDVAINQDLKALLLATGVSKQYFINYFKTLAIKGSGMTVAGIKQDELLGFVVALPSTAEQIRIVARVEELMALCDSLEAKGKLEAEQHARLVGSLFESLAKSESAHALTENWQRIATHFDLLLDRPAAVDALEQTILQLAVRGLLVPQNPADEPASALLQKIRAEKDRLIATGQLKRDKPLPPISVEEKPFELPEGWEWSRLGTVGASFDYGTSQKSSDIARGTPVLRMGNVQAGSIVLSNLKYFEDKEDDLPKLYLEPGDLLFNRTNSYELVGKTGVFRGEPDTFSFASYLIRIRLNSHLAAPGYINTYMNTSVCRTTQIEPQIVQQNGQANFNGTKLQAILVPLPPLPEQARIVARVAELRTLCTQLRERLAATAQIQSRLAATLIEKAVA